MRFSPFEWNIYVFCDISVIFIRVEYSKLILASFEVILERINLKLGIMWWWVSNIEYFINV